MFSFQNVVFISHIFHSCYMSHACHLLHHLTALFIICGKEHNSLQLVVNVSPDRSIHGYQRLFFSPEFYFFVGHIFFRVNWLRMCFSRRKFSWPYFTRTCARTTKVNYMRCIHVSLSHYGMLRNLFLSGSAGHGV